MHGPLPITRVLSYRIKTASVRVTARGNDPPQPLPKIPLQGRRKLLIMNFGAFGETFGTIARVVVGGAEIAWPAGTLPINGFGMDLYESVELDVDESVKVFALLDPTSSPNLDADLRIMELT